MKAAHSPEKNAWFWLGIAAVAGIALTAGWALYLEQKSFLTLQHVYESMVGTDCLLSDSTAAEANALVYVLTREPKYLESYQTARADLDEETDEVRTLVKNDPAQQAQLEKLRPLIRQTFANLAEVVRATDAGEAGRTMVLMKRADQTMDDAREIIEEMKAEERTALMRYSRSRTSRMHTDLAGVVGSTILAVGCLLLGQILMNRTASKRQRAEDELKVSERRFRALCEQAPVGIYETDAEGMCTYTNPRWSEISGLTPQESLGKGWKKALHPEDRASVFEGWRAAMERGARWEYRLKNSRGEMRWIHALGSSIYSGRGELTGYVGTLEDVTERKQAERTLQERDALNRAILNSLPANIAVLRGDGAIQAINEAWKRFAQANGDPPTSLVDAGGGYLEACRRAAQAGSRDAENALSGIEAVLAGKTHSFEMEYQSASEKKWFYMLVTPLAGVSAGGAVIAHVEVTDRKKAQQRFRLVVEAAPSGIVMYDRNGAIVLVNSKAEKLFGYERKELLGKSIEILAPESSSDEGLRAVFARPFERRVGRGHDLYARRKDGTQFPVEVGLNPVETEEGTCVLSSVLDITEKRRAEEERQKFVSLADRSLEFIGMFGLDFWPFYVNSAGMRLVGLDTLEAACALKIQDYFFPEDRPFITDEFFPRVLREGHGKVEIRFRNFKTGEPIWMLFNVFSICDGRGIDVGWATVSVDITERKRAERELKENRRELRALAGRLINAEEEERKRISRELHDDLSQKLALLAFDTGGLLASPVPPEDKLRDRLLNLRTRIVQLAHDVRQISHQLHPSILEDLGLTAALRELCDEFSTREGIEVLFEQGDVPAGLPVDVSSCLYRVAQEALHNVLKHAQTPQAKVAVSGCSDGVRLSVQDAGVGFNPEAVLYRHALGIVSMKERVRLVQGELSIHSQPGQGTEVRVFVPLPRSTL